MNKASIPEKIAGIILAIYVLNVVIWNASSQKIGIPDNSFKYLEIVIFITCCAFACVAGIASKNPKLVLGSLLLYVAYIVGWALWLPVKFPHYPYFNAAVVGLAVWFAPIAGAIVFVSDAFRRGEKACGFVAILATALFGFDAAVQFFSLFGPISSYSIYLSIVTYLPAAGFACACIFFLLHDPSRGTAMALEKKALSEATQRQ